MSRIFPVFGSWMRFMPTSMTAAPSFTISAVISLGTPMHRNQGHKIISSTRSHHVDSYSAVWTHHGWMNVPIYPRSSHLCTLWTLFLENYQLPAFVEIWYDMHSFNIHLVSKIYSVSRSDKKAGPTPQAVLMSVKQGGLGPQLVKLMFHFSAEQTFTNTAAGQAEHWFDPDNQKWV